MLWLDNLFDRFRVKEPLVVLPPKDLRWLNERGQCPDCQGKLFNSGPEGGMSMNIRCAECGSKFCFCGPFTPQRIDNPDCVYSIPYSATLESITGWKA